MKTAILYLIINYLYTISLLYTQHRPVLNTAVSLNKSFVSISEELKAFNSVKEKVKRLIRESKKQATLDSYINM